ncbi:ubiquitin fusion degradation protein UFD1AP [Cardiosporidium cionae]|uniref:Ubiquitin fusion degradation protein UFD1AP n=1 Tax=Cardiosporidium cionae TaxID=476202 RepID=A0ABQ7JAP9_9APIC|nr:ubiquitin fusion degradation protein UFD1AP [Cardiosporidium cionae]|eukprot:KAF8821075.1 ubiquitin fusion degradation protein UFD1AP [Cardiosporidium cionae]
MRKRFKGFLLLYVALFLITTWNAAGINGISHCRDNIVRPLSCSLGVPKWLTPSASVVFTRSRVCPCLLQPKKYFSLRRILSDSIQKTKVEQQVEDLNRILRYSGEDQRFYLVMPLSEVFDPSVGHFSRGHVLYGDKISFPRSVLNQLLLKKHDFPWHFSLEKIQGLPSSKDWYQDDTPFSPESSQIPAMKSMSPSTSTSLPIPRVFGSVLDFRSPENFIFVPPWMMQTLKLRLVWENRPRDIVRCQYTKLPEGSQISLRPHSKSFFSIKNYQDFLEKELRHYSCVTRGSTITLFHDHHIYLMDIVNASSDGKNSLEAVSIQDCDVSTIFLPPLSGSEEHATSSTEM